MVLWIGLLVAIGFAASSLKLGLYHAWATFFNVLIAVYLGVRLGPFVQEFIPAGGEYNTTLAMLAAAVVSFLILHGISYVFLIGQFDVTFPRTVGRLGSALFGFLAGLLIWSFVFLLVCTTPFSQNKYAKDAGISGECFDKTRCQGYLVWWCSAMDKFVGSAEADPDAGKAIAGLLFKPDATVKPVHRMPVKNADANEPNQPGAAVQTETVVPPARTETTTPESNQTLPP